MSKPIGPADTVFAINFYLGGFLFIGIGVISVLAGLFGEDRFENLFVPGIGMIVIGIVFVIIAYFWVRFAQRVIHKKKSKSD